MIPLHIASLGVYLPTEVETSAALEQRWRLPTGWIARAAGVRERRRERHLSSAQMAAHAARAAFAQTHLQPADVDVIIGASAGPQQAVPCTAAYVQRELGLPEGRSFCFDVNATCLSFLVGLHTAALHLASGAECVLLYSSEQTQHLLNPDEPESAVLLGDAAVATLLTRAPAESPSRLLAARFATHASGADLTVCKGGGTLHHPNDPRTTPAMNRFHMNGRGVLARACRLLGPFIDEFLTSVGWTRDSVDVLVPHQASAPGLAQLTTRYGFRDEQIVQNLAERGNCVAASVPLALAEGVAAGRVQRGQRVMLLGTGAGLTLGALGLVF